MAAIHIEPVPPRCSPGMVLAFICDRAKIDRTHVGKIAFLGRGATVEIAEAKLAAVVKALDGAEFNAKPVRVRSATRADYAEADHFGRLSRLLDLEAAAEEREAKERAKAGSDRGDGTTLTALSLIDQDYGLGGRVLLTFSRINRKEPLPPNRLGPGSPVLLTQCKVQRGFSSRGVVFDRTPNTLGVAIEPPDDDIPDDAVWRVDLSPDEASRLRQQDALRRASAADGDRLAELREVLLGEREPEFPPGTAGVPPATSPVASSETPSAIPKSTLAAETAAIPGSAFPPGTAGVPPATDPVVSGDSPFAMPPSTLAAETAADPGNGTTRSGLNTSQRNAIAFALAAKDVAIIHGPPGTGKTTTVAELIRQAVARGEKVLACAASNHAVDNLLDKLLKLGELPVRVGHPARVEPELRERALDILAEKHPDARQARKGIREASALFRSADKWTRAKPQPGEKADMRREARALLGEARKLEALAVERVLDDARIVCGTLTGLDSEVLGRRRFDLAVIDEACQATEPACWLPLLRADRVILAGDHCQLPPTVVSPEAAEVGLAVSMMERLVAMHGSQIAKMLTVQYRMHEAIAGFSSAEFYSNELIADESVAGHRLCDLPGVRSEPLTETPVQFIDTAGASYDEELEDDTSSRFNPQEASLAVRKARALLDAGVQPSQIAIIAPYRAQVRLLRDRLADVPGLEVDSVDGFQGREKEAVIITMVRSNPEGEIGFLQDVRRTNVALTRARRKLLVIGDSATLANHEFYQRMLEHFELIGATSSVWEEQE